MDLGMAANVVFLQRQNRFTLAASDARQHRDHETTVWRRRTLLAQG
jgi:hypothetical protein